MTFQQSLESGRPSAASAAITLAVTLFTAAAFLRTVSDLLLPVLLGIGGVCCLTASLHLLETSSQPASRLLASLLTVPVAVGFAFGGIGTSLSLVGSHFPVASEANISIAVLTIAGTFGVVVGCTLAVFGVTFGTFNVLASDPFEEFTKLAFATAIVPLVVGFGQVTRVTLFVRDSGASETLFGSSLQRGVAALFSPAGPGLHLASFLFALAVAAGSVWLVFRFSPVEELLANRFTRSTLERHLARVSVLALLLAVVSAVAIPFAYLLETSHSPAALGSLLGDGTYALVRLVTGAVWLRIGLVGIATLAAGWVATTALARNRSTIVREWFGPLFGGFVIALFAALVSEELFDRVVDETATRLPAFVTGDFLDVTAALQRIYGDTTVMILLAGVLVGLTAWIGLLAWLAVYLSYLDEEGAGYSLAAVGLFLAAVAAGTIGASRWLVFGGVVACLLVRDVGRFGTRLGREVGRDGSRGLEYVRTGAVGLVGVLAVAIAVGIDAAVTGVSLALAPSTTLALLLFVTGLVAFALPLR